METELTLRAMIAFGGTTALLAIVPSIGTQGMGTVGARVAHPDAALFDTDAVRRPAARTMLRRADAMVETAVAP